MTANTIQPHLTLTAPRYLLKLLDLVLSTHGDRHQIAIGIMASKDDAETSEGFHKAEVFPLSFLDRHYVSGGPPIYAIDLRGIPDAFNLSLADAWLDRALRERDSRVTPAYPQEPFTIEASSTVFDAVRSVFEGGSTIVQAPDHRPLASSAGLAFASYFPLSDIVWETLLESNPLQPIYNVLSVDENRTLVLQLHPDWDRDRKLDATAISETAG